MEQYNMRKDRYMQTDASINHLNTSQTSSRHGHNNFSDWTDEEWQAILLENYMPSDPSQFTTFEPKQTNQTQPSWWSWGYYDKTGPVKNFARNDIAACKGSYAFAAVGLMEIRSRLSGGTNGTLSRQQVLECSGDFGNFGCNGGTYDNVLHYAQIYGILKDEIYPFDSDNIGPCKYQELWNPD